ncbi:MAG TPA: dTDP-glucose 4,6-dehydratase [Vicinamibacterales bacterium]|nr:dTDP-glucose 4,6-dehydratase [Vicinamibacterales bacterium]
MTGGAGFIGSNFVRHVLARTPARIVVVDKLTYAGSLVNLAGVVDDPRVTFVKADIADRGAMADAFRDHRPTAVVNLAAETHVDRSIDGPAPFIDTNIVGTFVLLETALALSRELVGDDRAKFRFLHVSTDEVYGSLGADGLFQEKTPYAPNSPYAASKASADHLVRAYFHTYGLPTIITNCSNNYGPYQFPEKLIPLMILNALDGRALPIYGDGGNVRDWLHVEDHCAGVLTALMRGVPGEKYNIGGNSERTNLQVIEGICAALESLVPAATNAAVSERGSYTALRAFVPDRPGHDRRYAIDATKIHRELGWRPTHDFESGLEATVEWYVNNRAWCRAIQSGRYNRERLGLT